ncbi:MAG: YgfZ/GcvT domain-containing protein [Actinomycetes bacterium]
MSPDLVRVSGPDTWTFLQSLLSQDVEDLGEGERRAAMLLTPQGKVQVLLGVRRDGSDAVLDTDAGWGAALVQGLERFRIRTAVEIVLETEGEAPDAAADAERIAAGLPRMGVDLDDSVIPQEAELEVDAVSFTKGCFVGQELVCRIDSRGHVNRFLRRLEFEGSDVPRPGAVVLSGDREVGATTSVAPGRALAFVRREVEPGTEVTVDGVPATVHRRR